MASLVVLYCPDILPLICIIPSRPIKIFYCSHCTCGDTFETTQTCTWSRIKCYQLFIYSYITHGYINLKPLLEVQVLSKFVIDSINIIFGSACHFPSEIWTFDPMQLMLVNIRKLLLIVMQLAKWLPDCPCRYPLEIYIFREQVLNLHVLVCLLLSGPI